MALESFETFHSDSIPHTQQTILSAAEHVGVLVKLYTRDGSYNTK